MKYWTFEPNSCCFQRVSRRCAQVDAGITILNDGVDVYVARDGGPLNRWPSGDPLFVAGVLFERELFE